MAGPLSLLPHQVEGVDFIAGTGSVLLGDEPGVGKTRQAIAVTQVHQKILWFTFAALKFQLERDILQVLPNAKIQVINGSAGLRRAQWKTDSQYYIVNYELLLREDLHAMQAIAWGYIVADECTRLSSATLINKVTNKHGQKERRLTQVGAIRTIQATHKLAMTGTAVSNSPLDVYGIIDWLRPGSLGNFYQFCNRYVVKDMWGSPKYFQNLAELADRIKPFYIRRTKAQVFPDLPAITYTNVPFELTAPERKLYNQIRDELLLELEAADVSKVVNLSQLQTGIVKLMRLRQAACSLELLGDRVESSRVDTLRELLATMPDRKVILFTEFAEFAKILHRELPGSRMIVGGMTASEKDAVVRGFDQSTGGAVLIGTKAISYGLNLQTSDCVVHVDLPWSVASVEQREGRAHRYGQAGKVQVITLLANKTVDSYVQKKLQLKQDLAEMLLPVSEVRKALTM